MGARHPGPEVDRRPPDRAPRLDRPVRPARRDRRRGLRPGGREGARLTRRLRGRGCRAGGRAAPGRLLAEWRAGRQALEKALRAAPAGTRFPWYGPPMSVASMATGRLMETWAHGQDIADALRVTRPATDRLRHVARIGVRARDFAFGVRGLTPPEEEFRVELTAPSGEVWSYGPEVAAQRVTGPALDFCLLVTQRANRVDLAVRAEGLDADRWLDIAQAFAGPPGTGRAPKGPAE
ncbi:TIGR03084 family metal-binding protein [Streptomyces sp. NPDC020707]|uniref:TIGR03084 family metal-binding protein n=1 Tax=Streptomyces sp. NPDC020707 TaxID=3365084 RepID=UPI0037992202